MANVKKRKATPQSATLHDFFGNTQAKKKAKSQQNVLPPKGQQRKPFRPPVPPEDIIVIDSDDETIVVVPAPTDRGQKQPGVKQEEKPVSSQALKELSNSQDRVLSPSAAVKCEDDGSDDLYEDAGFSFGQPSSLLVPVSPIQADEADYAASSVRAGTCSDVPPVSSSEEIGDCSNTDLVPTADEEWAMGDDEIEQGDIELKVEQDEEEAVDIDLTLTDDESTDSDYQGRVEVCPLCDMKLRGLSEKDVHEHVNSCIDSMSGQSTPGASSSKAFAPSTSATPQIPHPLPSLQAVHPSQVKQEPDTDSMNTTKCGTGAFSVLMSSYKETEAWKEASAAEDRGFRPTKGNGGRRKAPFYKVMQGMPIAVDAFRYGTIPGVTAYFLTHAHSDHYTNLSANWRSGPIYCSEGTANLIVHMLCVDRQWVCPLPMDVPTLVPDTGGVCVTLIEANHCPGSCLFLFEGPQTVHAGDSAFRSPFVGATRTFRYLHCGDFRASPQHVLHPAIRGKHIDHVYLDTTYLDPKYCFPPQPQVISACAELARRIVRGETLHDSEDIAKARQNRTMDSWLVTSGKSPEKDTKPGKILVVVGTYSIGKERIVKAIARALQTKVYCDSRKAAILRCQADPELHDLLTKDPLEGGVHLVPLGVIASDRLKDYVERFKGHYIKAVGFRPTGWTFSAPTGSDMVPSVSTIIARTQGRTFTHAHLSPMRNSTAALQVYGVPYSEHSSFFELTCFALSLDWGRMIATVNVGSEKSRNKMGTWIERWEVERKKRAKGEMVQHRAQNYW